jgi:hypothetical protein
MNHMKRSILFAFSLLFALTSVAAQEFDSNFTDKTLRIDYTFSGNSSEQYIALRELSSNDGWWGRRVNLSDVPLEGNGDLTLYDAKSGDTIHMIVEVQDDGAHTLKHYQRVVITVA